MQLSKIKCRKLYSRARIKFMQLLYIDIHNHIQFSQFDKDRQDVISRMYKEGIGGIVVGVDEQTSQYAIELAEKNDNIFASVGLHPGDVGKKPFNTKLFKEFLSHEKTVAVGECGLDYYTQHSDNSQREGTLTLKEKNDQKSLFLQHISLAVKADKPLMIHCRDAYDDLIDILTKKKEEYGDILRGNVHFFAGNWEIAQKLISLNFTLSFTGVITFTNDYDEVIARTPLEMIMIETDAPFVAPTPYRGRRNEPIYVKEVMKRIAEIKKKDEKTVTDTILKNTKRVFKLQ